MMLIDRNRIEYVVLFRHPCGDYFVRYAMSEQRKWVRGTDSFYSKLYIKGENYGVDKAES